MHFEQLDLNLLVALDALLTDRSITAAGVRVHLTQSAMSGTLSRLREFFGDELLTQVGRKMVPTPLGESLAEPVRQILLQIKATINTNPGFDPATSTRHFSLMMSDYVATVLMPGVLRRAETLAPLVRFHIVSNDVTAPTEFLERADVDLLIMPREYLSEKHPLEDLFTDNYACVVWKDNPLVGAELTQELYLQLGHVVLQFGRGRVPVQDEWFLERLGVTRRIEVVALSFNSLPQYIVGSRRIATIHRRLAEYYARYLPLRILKPPFDLPSLTESVQWHSLFDPDPGNRWLRDLLRQGAAEVPCSCSAEPGGWIAGPRSPISDVNTSRAGESPELARLTSRARYRDP
ncbi:MAG TPA: LysR family transcriptional regulator [Steroidobacteraceae bacterium]|jgi:DNA-binding transcriptional LysR family regulator